jgi:hypothetical protein
MAWLNQLKNTAKSTTRTPAVTADADADKPFLVKMAAIAEAAAQQSDDPWEPILRGLKGTVVGGVERIATFRVFELLGVPPRAQSSDIRRRLAKRMVELGWQPIRAHGLNERSFLTRVRGFSRVADHEGAPLLPPNTTKAGRRPQPLM